MDIKHVDVAGLELLERRIQGMLQRLGVGPAEVGLDDVPPFVGTIAVVYFVAKTISSLLSRSFIHLPMMRSDSPF
jgi:hypothetical protein